MMNICRFFVLMSRKYLFERYQFSFSVTEKETITNLISVLLTVFFFLTLSPRVVYSSEYFSRSEIFIHFRIQVCYSLAIFLRTFQSQANHGEFSWIFYIKRRASKQTLATCTCNIQEVSSLHHHFTSNSTAAWILRLRFFFQTISYYHWVSETSWVSSKM